MANISGKVGGNFCSSKNDTHDQISNKRHPPLHDQQQKPSEPNNLFSIDRTFSVSSTDIQPSFDIFDEDDEDDRNDSQSRKSSKAGFGKAGAPSRAEMYKKEMMACHRHHRNQNDNPNSERSSFFSSRKNQEFADFDQNKSYYLEGDESIGVPSDISGMLRDSDEEEDEKSVKAATGEKKSDPRGGNNATFTDGGEVAGDSENNNGPCNFQGGTDGQHRGNSSEEQNGKSGNSNGNGGMRTSVISDGRFGSIRSVSSSFNSAAAAACGSSTSGYSNKFGMSVLATGGGPNNNDILNERLDRLQRYTRGPYAPLDRTNSTSVSSAHSSTITQHYYPERGWGYVILATASICHMLMYGLHLSSGIFLLDILSRFGEDLVMSSVWLISISMGSSLFLSPLWVSICKRKSTRLTAVFGGLVAALGCLFCSFAGKFEQAFISFGIILSIGIGLTRDASYLMTDQYFKKRKDFVEVFLVAASGLGILVMTLALHTALSGLGWRFGLQAITIGLFSTFFLGTCYRSASLYHPQRRAIVHLKNQKRKIKEKGKKSDKPPFLDCSCLSSRSFQALVLSTTFTSFGCYSPLFHLALECTLVEVPKAQVIFYYLYIGAGWILGSCLFGMTVVQRNEDCRISKPYLLQGSVLIIGGAIFALPTIYEDHGLGSFCWIYGIGLGSYNYVLKAWTYEKTRAKNFSRAWSFVQCAQGLGCILGVPATGYMNNYAGWRMGYFMSSASIFFSAIIIFCCGMSRRGIMRNKSGTSSMKTCETFDSSGMQSPTTRRISFTFPDEQISPRFNSKASYRSAGSGYTSSGIILSDRNSVGSSASASCSTNSCNNDNSAHHQPLLQDQPQARMPKELTCISEEGAVEPHGPV